MSSEIWKIGQDIKAEDYYNNIKNSLAGAGIFMVPQGEVAAVSRLTQVCREMIDAYNDVIEDQKDYVIELDNVILRAEDKANEIQLEIEQLKKEIISLAQKEESGEITDEEKDELKAKQGELYNLQNHLNTTSIENNDEIKTTGENQKSEFRSKEKIASEYGKTAVEKGTPLAATKVKGGFFRKLFGNTGKYKKMVGEGAVSAGNDLLNKVADSVELQNDIDKKIVKKAEN